MKFQVPSYNGLKVTAGTKSVTHPRMHACSKSNMPHQLLQSLGHKNQQIQPTPDTIMDFFLHTILTSF